MTAVDRQTFRRLLIEAIEEQADHVNLYMGSGGATISFGRCYKPRRSRAEIAADARRRRVHEEARRLLLSAPMPEVWPFIQAGSESDDLIGLIDSVVPRTLPELIRQEVCQDVALVVLEGVVAREAIADVVAAYVGKVVARYPSLYGPLSLDAPRDFGDTLGDTIAAPALILGTTA